MYRFTFMICLGLLMGVMAQGQQQTSLPVKNKSNRIILHFKDTTGLFTLFAKSLIDQGYEFQEKDRELGILKTKPLKHPGGWSFENEIKAVFRDSTLMLSDIMYSGGYKFDLMYVEKKGIIHYKAWNYIMEIANSLKPQFIMYAEQK